MKIPFPGHKLYIIRGVTDSGRVSGYFRDKSESWAISMDPKSFQECHIGLARRVLPCLMFLLILAVGLIVYDDYGIPYDKVADRKSVV